MFDLYKYFILPIEGSQIFLGQKPSQEKKFQKAWYMLGCRLAEKVAMPRIIME